MEDDLAKNKGTVIIGWTGSHSTLKYLEGIENVLQTIEKRYKHVSFLVIANREPDLNISRLRFIKWRENTEVQDLLTIDIGLMPLSDDDWTRGKCGFKALQYMALGIPPVSSPVGVNRNIIQDGVNGYLVQSHDEWVAALSKLIEDVTQRKIIGENAAKKIEQEYSVKSNRANFLSLFS
jgi:glycosyltransferase involved in cell wall biosynthesis